MFVAFILLSACTDYVSQIEDRIEERERASIINQSSDDSRFTSSDSRSGQDQESSNSSVVNPALTGNLTDSRDGQTYKIVKIGEQIWMAENLNYKTKNSWCGGGNGTAAGDCSKYGRLYTWAAAMDSVGTWSTNGKGCGYGTTCSPTYPVRGICPEGWHLPTEAEFETLFTAVGGKSTAGKVLKSTTGWTTYSGNTNEDAFAFSALPAGYRNNNGGYYVEGDGAYFWSSTEDGSNYAYYMYLYYSRDDASLGSLNKSYGFSVRCLKD